MKKALAKQNKLLESTEQSKAVESMIAEINSSNEVKQTNQALSKIDATLTRGLFDAAGNSLNTNLVKLVDAIKSASKGVATPTSDNSKDLKDPDPKTPKFRTIDVRAKEFKDNAIAATKDFLTPRGFLDKTGIAKRGSGGLLSEHLDKAEYEKKGFVGAAPKAGSEEVAQEMDRKAQKTNDELDKISENTEETNEILKQQYEFEKKKKPETKESGGILSSIGGLLKGLIPGKLAGAGGIASGIIGKGAGILKTGATAARGLAIPAAIAGAAGAGIDWVSGKFGVGKDKEGNDIKVNTKQDDANWEKMSFGEKLQSGLARGIEKVGGALFLGNMANQAKSDRIEKETAYFAQKEKRKPKNLENTVEINISEASFAENDPENYQKYQAEKLKIAKDYLEKNPPRTKSTGSMNAARKRAMMHAKTMAAQKFRKEIEAAGAGSVKGGISAQDTTPTPNTTPNVKLDSKTKATGWKPSASVEVNISEATFAKNDPENYQKYNAEKSKAAKEYLEKNPARTNSTNSRNLAHKKASMHARGVAAQKFSSEIEAAGAGSVKGAKSVQDTPKPIPAGNKQASNVYNQSAMSEDAKRAAASKRAEAPSNVTVVNNDNKTTQNTPYSLPTRKEDFSLEKYTGSRHAY